jgi:hypothetical protein
MTAEAPSDAPDASGAPEVIRVPCKPGEAVCARCGRVWVPSADNVRWGIGPVRGVMAGFCTPCVREVEKEVEIALQTKPWEP